MSEIIETYETIVEDILAEVERAKKKFPQWPDDLFHALCIVQEEVGELSKAVLELSYSPADLYTEHKRQLENVRIEAVQSAATLIRFLQSFDMGSYRIDLRPSQHIQP